MKPTYIIGIIVVIALIAGAVVVTSKNTVTNQIEGTSESIVDADVQVAAQVNTEVSPDTNTESTQETKVSEDRPQAATGTYTTYSPELLAQAATGDVVLFFHASWCPSCRSINQQLIKDAASIPANLTILKTDFDQYAALKQQYGVVTQHTFVQVDANGTMLKKWSGGGLDNIIEQVR